MGLVVDSNRGSMRIKQMQLNTFHSVVQKALNENELLKIA